MDTKDLETKLLNLTGKDFELAEFAERNSGNTMPLITFSAAFQARLAAMALGVLPDDIKNLPIQQYNAIVSRVSNFLFAPSAEATAQ